MFYQLQLTDDWDDDDDSNEFVFNFCVFEFCIYCSFCHLFVQKYFIYSSTHWFVRSFVPFVLIYSYNNVLIHSVRFF